jgi:hypothetical protein
MTAVVSGVRRTGVYQGFRVQSHCARLLLFAAQGPRYFPRYGSACSCCSILDVGSLQLQDTPHTGYVSTSETPNGVLRARKGALLPSGVNSCAPTHSLRESARGANRSVNEAIKNSVDVPHRLRTSQIDLPVRNRTPGGTRHEHPDAPEAQPPDGLKLSGPEGVCVGGDRIFHCFDLKKIEKTKIGQRRVACESAGMVIRQSGDEEGAATFDPANPTQVRLAMKYAKYDRNGNYR